MSEKRISPLHQCLTEDTPAGSGFYADWRKGMIEPVDCLRSAESQQLLSALHSSEFA